MKLTEHFKERTPDFESSQFYLYLVDKMDQTYFEQVSSRDTRGERQCITLKQRYVGLCRVLGAIR